MTSGLPSAPITGLPCSSSTTPPGPTEPPGGILVIRYLSRFKPRGPPSSSSRAFARSCAAFASALDAERSFFMRSISLSAASDRFFAASLAASAAASAAFAASAKAFACASRSAASFAPAAQGG